MPEIFKKYFIVGMPSSGKSTIGRLTANQLGLNFLDLDHLITEHEGCSISHIFEQQGEHYFRQLERELLKSTIEKERTFIMATGGGAPCFYNNMDLMNESGVTIYLDVPVGDLHTKLASKGTGKRPLLKDIPKDDLYLELANKYERRRNFYEQSTIWLVQPFRDMPERANEVILAIRSLEK